MKQEHVPIQRVDLQIAGMHCASCEVLIERKFKKIPGVLRVRSNNATGRAKVLCERVPSLDELNAAVGPDGYTVRLRGEAPAAESVENTSQSRHLGEVGGIAAIIIALYFVLRQFNIGLPEVGVLDTMSYGFVFVLGLVAAVSTCIAVTGGLLVAVATRYSELHPDLSGFAKFKPHLYFNAGRIVSYTLLGGAVGALGSFITLSTRATGIMTVIASLIMIALGFQMLHLFPWMKRVKLPMPKFLAHRVHDASSSDHRAAPFLLGAATFFMPCGFTQALQLYVLSQGGFVRGALTMLVFSLGTMPALMSLSALTSFAKGSFLRYFVKTAGVVVVLLGLLNINNGLALAGVSVDFSALLPKDQASEEISSVPVKNGKQIAEMKVVGYEYYPSRFTVQAGVPVEWRIDGSKAAGCAQVITMPKMQLLRRLSRTGVTTISFTPQSAGSLEFSCTMGMTTPGAKFAVVAGKGKGSVQQEPRVQGDIPFDYSKCDPRYAMCL